MTTGRARSLAVIAALGWACNCFAITVSSASRCVRGRAAGGGLLMRAEDRNESSSKPPPPSSLLSSMSLSPGQFTRRQVGDLSAAMLGLGSSVLSADAGEAATVTSEAGKAAESRARSVVPPPAIPFSTRRQYRDITLRNGVRVLLVNDKGATNRCSAALSIGGAGQFAEPPYLPGLAHLMEHMVLSSSSARGGGKFGVWRQSGRPDGAEGDNLDEDDFEEWLTNNDGASNAFTAPGSVLFHFTCPPEAFPESLERFATLFMAETVESVCHKDATIRREVRRIDGELDTKSDAARAFYLLKSRANPEHPFSRFSAGNIDTLEQRPQEQGLDVAQELLSFFNRKYRPDRAVLVVIGSSDLRTLERWVGPYSLILSRKMLPDLQENPVDKQYPDPFLISPGARVTQTLLLRSKDDPQYNENVETLSLEWPLGFVYGGSTETATIAAPTIGFILSQILGRRGPGSLYLFLERLGFVPKGNKGVPRITFPIDVSGFQMLKLEIGLTLQGFANRSAVIAAVYESINSISQISGIHPFLLPRELIVQYMAIATLHGYNLAPRPPDAIELAVDSQVYGVGGTHGVGVPGYWPLMPSQDDDRAVEEIRNMVASTLTVMCNPLQTFVTIRASAKAIFQSSGGIFDQAVTAPPLFAPWQVEPRTSARFFVENRFAFPGLVEPLVWAAGLILDDIQIGPPVLNPLVPPRLRPARPVLERRTFDGGRRFFYLEGSNSSDSLRLSATGWGVTGEGVWREFVTQLPVQPKGCNGEAWGERAVATVVGDDWKLWQAAPSSDELISLPLPMSPPEPTGRASFVLQLLSKRPSRSNSRQAAHGELWLLSFDDFIIDLAELGAPAGLAYEVSFNPYGLRICFRGISQTLPSYARRFCRRLVEHHKRLMDGSSNISPSTLERAVIEANRSRGISQLRKRQIIEFLRGATSRDAGAEGSALLSSFSGGLALAQGDLLPFESVKLLNELKTIFGDAIPASDAKLSRPYRPDLDDILYRPVWKPRSSSPCLIPGVEIISDACGRIQR